MTTTQTTAKKMPKKGDTIFVARVWSRGDTDHMTVNPYRPAISIRELRVESWGKQQATFTHVETGEFIRERGYTEHFSFSFTRDGLATEIESLEESIRNGLRRSAEGDSKWLEEYRNARSDVIAKVKNRMESVLKASEGPVLVADYCELRNSIRLG
jgi:type III secretory pathway component EscV